LQYHGKLNYAGRDKAITSFGDKPHIRILLASLRCGGLGLNLTMASRVIVVDPWWNNASEQQGKRIPKALGYFHSLTFPQPSAEFFASAKTRQHL